MATMIQPWDYLIVTASSAEQAAAFQSQLDRRQCLGLLPAFRKALVLPDPCDKRIGSGASTILCLMTVLGREGTLGDGQADGTSQWRDVLAQLRILIVHAGGDARRLPAYGACGKLFMPAPGQSDAAIPVSLFDRQIKAYAALPAPPRGTGQVVIASGDVLVLFDASRVSLAANGATGLGCLADPEQAGKHGVYCADDDGGVRRFLQKCSPAEQTEMGAIRRDARVILDVGVMSFDAETGVQLLDAFGVRGGIKGEPIWKGQIRQAADEHGLDLYREICCALGRDVTAADYITAVGNAGSRWDDATLGRVFEGLRAVPFSVEVLPDCRFLHFGVTREIIGNGLELQAIDGVSQPGGRLDLNNRFARNARITGGPGWVEGCRLEGDITLGGNNVVVGLDVVKPLALPEGACLEVVPGRDRSGRSVSFVRCYGVDDNFKDDVRSGATLFGRPLDRWLDEAGLEPQDVWPDETPEHERTVWTAALFPAIVEPSQLSQWLWMATPDRASRAQKDAYRAADRYSPAEIAALTDYEAFYARRARLHAESLTPRLRRLLQPDSGFSSADLHQILATVDPPDRADWVKRLLAEARHCVGVTQASDPHRAFAFPRVLHTIATAIAQLTRAHDADPRRCLPGLSEALSAEERAWLAEAGLSIGAEPDWGEWAERARSLAMRHVARTIVASGGRAARHPTSALRSDEIVWGRSPARLDLAGGWTDTPPYALEHGGCVINAAVDLNGQPPVHCYARVTTRPVIRIASIDLGTQLEIATLEELLDFGPATSEFALAKAALALSGFSPAAADRPGCETLEQMLRRFGGGIELTTLAAIPKGSGLGTSSITGAVILAVVHRMMGRALSRRELFHAVLRLEQALTTGGGWQDQIGGAVDGVKLIRSEAGLVPDPAIRHVPTDILDPAANGGRTLLYYTGITRLAKDILQHVVGRYLDRDRQAMETLRQIHALPDRVADVMAGKDLAAFGESIDRAWELNKRLDPNSTNDAVEALLDRVRPHVYGAKLLGAGGGGFLLMVCRSRDDAAVLRTMLEQDPPNERARFFDFAISTEGLVVTTC